MESEHGERILVIQTGFLGDVVLSTPVFSELREIFPNAQITLLTTPGAAPMLAGHPCLDEVIVFDKRGAARGVLGLLAMARELRAKQFTSIYCLHKSHRTALLVALVRARQSVGFKEAAFSWLYSTSVTRKEYAHEVQRNLAILKPLGVDPLAVKRKMSLGFLSEHRDEASRLLGEGFKNAIALAPGSVWATKRWTVEGFSVVARELIALGYPVVLIGGPDDHAIAEQILAGVESKERICNLVGACSLPVSAAVIDMCQLIVSNDSSPLHMAAATNTPVVAVFCATVPEFGFGPWQVPSRVLGVEGLSCRPCGRHGGNTCPTGTHACQRQLAPESVILAVRELLQASGS